MIDLWSYNYDLLSDEGDWDDPTGDHDDGMESEGDETCDRFAYAQPRPLPSAEGEGGTGPTEDGVTPAEGGVAVVDDDDDAPNRPDPEEFNDGRYSVISSSTFSLAFRQDLLKLLRGMHLLLLRFVLLYDARDPRTISA